MSYVFYNQRLSVMISKEMMEAIDMVCKDTGLTCSEVVRNALWCCLVSMRTDEDEEIDSGYMK